MIAITSTQPLRITDFELESSTDYLGSKISFHSPDALEIKAPLQVSLDGKNIFEGSIEARRFSFGVERLERQTAEGTVSPCHWIPARSHAVLRE